MKKLFAIAFLVLVSVGSAFAQPDIQLKGLRKLPKGITVAKLKTHVIKPEHTRNIEIEEVNPSRQVRYKFPKLNLKFKTKPKLNVNKFGDTIHAVLKDNVTGYIMQVRQDGNLIYNLVWKRAQTTPNANIPWNEDTKMHVASVSKFLTAVGLVKLLDEKGISYDAKIVNYLPNYWSKGSNVNQITFRHLLTHKSGFKVEITPTDQCGCATDYLTMKNKVAEGVSNVGSGSGYENANFGLMRILIPIINGDIDKNTNFPPDITFNNILWDGATIAFYEEYMQDKVFTPAGVGNVGFAPNIFVDALAYPFPQANQPGWNSGNLSTVAGGAGWRLSSKQLLNVMNHVRRKNTIIPAPKAQFMLDNNFGIDEIADTPAGKFYNKNGAWGGNGKTEQCVAYFMPNGMEVVIFVNSPVGMQDYFLRGLVNDAFLNSLAD